MEKPGVYQKGISRRFTLCILVTAGFLFLQTISLNAEADTAKQIAAEIQKIKDANEPVSIEELVPPDIPDSENGALIYKDAFSLLDELKDRHKKEWENFPFEGKVKWEDVPGPERKRIINLLLKGPDFVRFYQLIEKASCMKCRFLKREEYLKGAAMVLPHLASLRSCARMLAARAFILAETGQVDNSLRDCIAGLKIAGSLSEEPILISGLVRIAIDNLMLLQAEAAMKKGEAQPETYRALMEKAAEERNCRMLYHGLLGERVVFGMMEFPRLKKEVEEKKDIKPIMDLFGDSGKGETGITPASEKDIMRFLEENELLYLKMVAYWISFSRKPYWEIRSSLTDIEEEVKKIPDEKSCLVKSLVSAFSRIFSQEARLDAQLGNAEIALACHLYKTEYKTYPASLQELSPEFLPKPSLDPFTGNSYIYRKTHSGFIVYSVGDNLKDDGGVSQNEKKWQGDYDIVWER